MVLQRQRRTQTDSFWLEEFTLGEEDIDYLYESLMEEGEPRSTEELSLKLIEQQCQKEELAQSKQRGGQAYQPQQQYEVGQKVVFPALEYGVGQVLAIRPGSNPRYGAFNVIQVKLDGETVPREFAAEFTQEHWLNRSTALLQEGEELSSPQQLYELYGAAVDERLESALQQRSDFVHLDGQWFLHELLPEVTPFQLNIAEAIIDERRHPVSVTQLLERTSQVLKEMGLPTEGKTSVQSYALAYALGRDPRFAEINGADGSSWYLSNSIPEGVRHKPRRLVPAFRPRGGEWLNRELHDFVAEILDEADELPQTKATALGSVESVQSFLIYPHRREGTISLTARALGLLSERPAERFMVTFVDQHSRENMPGWMVPAEGYAWGLGDWYRRHELPVGSVVELHRMEDPFTFLVSYEERKRKREWVREARTIGNKLTITVQPRAYDCRYDKYLLIAEGNPEDLDGLWSGESEPSESLFDHLVKLFPELAKLSGQGLVHAKTLYSAVNLTRRCGAVPIFAELTRRACFDPVGDGNWVYDESLRNTTYTTPEEMSRRPNSRRQDVIVDRVYSYEVSKNEVGNL